MDWLGVVRYVACVGSFATCASESVLAQVPSPGQPMPVQPAPVQSVPSRQAVQARLRPMGAPSAVDAFVSPSQSGAIHSGASVGSSVRRVTVMQIPVDSQPMAAPSLPANGFAFPNSAQPLPNNIAPPSSPGGFALPSNGLPSNGLPAPLQSTAPAGPIAPPPSLPSQPLPQSLPPNVSAPATALPLNPNPAAVAPLPTAPRVTSPPQGLPINPNVSSQPMPNTSVPMSGGLSTTVPRTSAPSVGAPGAFAPGFATPPSASDYAAIPQPQLDNAFATMDNCRNITGPSTYRAAGFFGCSQPAAYTSPVYGPPVYGAPTSYVPPPSQVAPAVALPPGATYAPIGMTGSVPPVLPGSPGYRPLFTLGQEKNPVQVGQGFWGQPVAYVPGQTLRNGLRYISF